MTRSDMTEQKWLSCADPAPMLYSLRDNDKLSDRKLRLFACACCRWGWHLLIDPRSRRAVEVAERYADGLASTEELESAHEAARNAKWDSFGIEGIYPPGFAAEMTTETECEASAAAVAAVGSCFPFPRRIGILRRLLSKAVREAQKAAQLKLQTAWSHQAHLLRDVFGPLLFRPVAVEAAWLSWHDKLIASMAQQMYDARDFADMPVLADALEEAGCDNADILNHCRQPGEHVRGCWVVDLLLNKS